MKYMVEIIGMRHDVVMCKVNNGLMELDDFIQRLRDDSKNLTSFTRGGYNGE